ncbi:phage portal protein [Xanthomonas cannabis]|uniref:phage portal protein n=2 Tax=Xanthomonas cannabis TaxID=1885674 RepID=UPI0033B37851
MGIADRLMSLITRRAPAAATAISPPGGGGWRNVLEPFTGAWQRNQSIATPIELETYSTVYACMSRISSDIGKLPFTLKRRDANGLWIADRHQTISPLLRRPNSYQTPAQFREAWILSKLSRGNTYVLKGRNSTGAVTHLWVLDPNLVEPMVAPSGDVFYRLRYGRPENLLPEKYAGDELIVPASEIIHDREMALFHQLIGIGPLDAATLAANKNIRIQQDATKFFTNGANPGGILTAPAGMSETDAQAVKEYWNTNFQGANAGKVAVIGADMKFTAFAFKAIDSQMVEQLRYSDEQIAHAFGIPPFKVGIGSIPAGMKVDDLNQMYYADALQARIEAMEDCLDQALGLGDEIGVELNLEPLLRMDLGKQAEVHAALTGAGIEAPNEARRRFGLSPLTGGDSVYLQQQNYSLEALARRDSSPDPFATGGTGERGLSPARLLTRDLPGGHAKQRAKFNHDDGSWDVEIAPNRWLHRVRTAQLENLGASK